MAQAPVYDFVSDGVQNTVWVITDEADIETIGKEFAAAGDLYIADGHHRCASAARVGKMRREQNPGYTGEEEFNYFLAVLFPDEQLYIMDYNRVVKDLNGLSDEEFMEKMKGMFHIKEYCGEGQYRPESKHTFGMYLNDKWYILTAHGDIWMFPSSRRMFSIPCWASRTPAPTAVSTSSAASAVWASWRRESTRA